MEKTKAYRFRYFRTMYDKIVGIMVEKPDGECICQMVGQQPFEFDDAPKLEMLHLYVETIAKKPTLKHLQIYDVSKIYKVKHFTSCQQLIQEGRNFLL